MGSPGQIQFRKVRRMLKACAPDYRLEWKLHKLWIHYDGKVYKSFPKGPGKKQQNFEVDARHVRALAEALEIEECAKQKISGLG